MQFLKRVTVGVHEQAAPRDGSDRRRLRGGYGDGEEKAEGDALFLLVVNHLRRIAIAF